MQNPYGKILKQITSSLEHLKLHAQMQIKAHPLHVSRSPSFTPTIILTNAWTFIKAAAFANRSTPPWAQSFRDPFAHPAFKTTVTHTQKHPHVETHVLQGCCSSIIFRKWLFNSMAHTRGSACLCVCEGEGGLHYDKSHLNLGQSIKFVMGKHFVVTPPPKNNSDGAKSKNMEIHFHKCSDAVADCYGNERENAEKWEIKPLI